MHVSSNYKSLPISNHKRFTSCDYVRAVWMSNTIITGSKGFAHSCLKSVSWPDVHVSFWGPILDLGA